MQILCYVFFSCLQVQSVLDVCVQCVDSMERFVSNLDDVMMLFLVLYTRLQFKYLVLRICILAYT